jgi:hypothetical protein
MGPLALSGHLSNPWQMDLQALSVGEKDLLPLPSLLLHDLRTGPFILVSSPNHVLLALTRLSCFKAHTAPERFLT